MNHSVLLRLTLFYLGIIMAMSIAFSFVIYHISSDELRRGARQPGITSVQLIEDPAFQVFERARREQVDTSKYHLQRNLVLLNIGTLALGAVISYALARRTLQPIEEAFDAQGRFTADASHELRTPLTAMQTSIEVGLRNPKLTLADSKELLHSMLDEVQKLSSLSNGLLKLTRSSGQDMPRLPVDLTNVAQEAIAQLELTANHKHITLVNDVEKIRVTGDEVSIKEALVILLDNAIKYSPKDKTITINARQQGRFGHLSVIDQGPGIKATDMEHIFDRFYRADSSRSRDAVEGYGLGLSIAQKIAQAHNGSLDARSRLGEGSTFTLKLPLHDRD
jgi:two-component system sensor histidine kinase CiaH